MDFIPRKETGHWYACLSDRVEPRYDADLRVARKEGLFPSVTEIEHAVRANPVLARWIKNETIKAAVATPRNPGETDEAYGARLVEVSDRVSQEARDFGIAVHEAIADYPQIPLDPAVRLFYDKFASWWPDNFFETFSAEACVADRDLGYAGRMDRGGVHKQFGPVVVDFKSQKIRKKPAFYPEWARQLAAYRACLLKGGRPEPLRCLSVIIDSNEPKEPIAHLWTEEEITQGYKEFLCHLWLWCSERNYWPGRLGRWEPTLTTLP